jgi:hypothetical protein
VRFWFGVGGAVVALIVTGYLGAMTLAWGLHIQTLRAEQNELVLLEAERSAVLAEQNEELEELDEALMGDLRAVTEGAHDKALYEDLRYIYDDYAFALKACADERAEVVDVVRQRYLYITWTVHRYDDSVAEYCNQLKVYWAEALAEEES